MGLLLFTFICFNVQIKESNYIHTTTWFTNLNGLLCIPTMQLHILK